MPRNYRTCIYKNCFATNQRTMVKESRISFFRFPKDTERRKLWMKLADVPLNTPERLLCICSRHFERKFMSVNQRRSSLVGLAVPFPSEKDFRTLTIAAEEDKRAYIELEETHIPEVNSQLESEEHNEYSTPTPNTEIIESQLESEGHNEYSTAARNTEIIENSNAMIDKQHVSKFISNGKVYVKMRLDYYKREKQALLNKIQAYKEIIDKIRNEVQSVDMVSKT